MQRIGEQRIWESFALTVQYYKPTVHNPTYCELLKYDHSSSPGLYMSKTHFLSGSCTPPLCAKTARAHCCVSQMLVRKYSWWKHNNEKKKASKLNCPLYFLAGTKHVRTPLRQHPHTPSHPKQVVATYRSIIKQQFFFKHHTRTHTLLMHVISRCSTSPCTENVFLGKTACWLLKMAEPYHRKKTALDVINITLLPKELAKE